MCYDELLFCQAAEWQLGTALGAGISGEWNLMCSTVITDKAKGGIGEQDLCYGRD